MAKETQATAVLNECDRPMAVTWQSITSIHMQ